MWWKRRVATELLGSVLFRGGLPPLPRDFEALADHGFRLTRESDVPGAHFQFSFRHVSLGDGVLVCLRDAPPVPDSLIEHEQRLSDGEKELARLGRSSVTVKLTVPGEHVLRERKRLLRVLRFVLGDDGVLAVDHTAQAMWSRAALDEELAHDADLDILGLFTAHVVTGEDDRGYWLHTHGFRELGFSDFDVLDPPEDIGRCWDLIRALAFGVVEGRLVPGGPACTVVGRAPPAALVPSRKLRERTGSSHRQWQEALDDEHVDGHAVVCDAPKRGVRALFGAPPAPWSVLRGELPDDMAIQFSDQATALMSERAGATLPLFRQIALELEPFDVVAMAKLRFEGPNGNEHLWFEVHGFDGDSLDATLTNQPWQEIGVERGQRGTHSLERLSDWTVLTPAGNITPRHMTSLRLLRERREELLALVRSH